LKGGVFLEEDQVIETIGCDAQTEVYTRVVGFYRPVNQWNDGKREEYEDRKEYAINN
jgi:anaerobic ribonucleoside-triphosphate reductase